jgi:hypothetical protein
MKRTVERIDIELDDELCRAFEEKFTYPITELECRVYASSRFDLMFDEVKKRYSPKEIARAIEDAIREELPV